MNQYLPNEEHHKQTFLGLKFQKTFLIIHQIRINSKQNTQISTVSFEDREYSTFFRCFIRLLLLYLEPISNLFMFHLNVHTYNKMLAANDSRICGIDRDILAILMMAFGSSFLFLGFIYCNEQKFHPTFSCFIRGITITILSSMIAKFNGIDLTFKSSHNFKWQMLRNVIMAAHGLIFAWSQYYLPLPVVITLNNSSPLFAAIFNRVIYGISLNSKQTICLCVAFFGVILTANGSLIQEYFFGNQEFSDTSTFQNYISKQPSATFFAAALLTGIQCAHGYGVVVTKKLVNTNGIHVNYFVGLTIAFSAALCLPSGMSDPVYHRPSMQQLFKAVMFSGIPISLGMLGYNGSLTISRNYSIVTPFQFMSIVAGYLVSFLRYNERINYFCLMGAIAIVLGIIFIVVSKQDEKTVEVAKNQK